MLTIATHISEILNLLWVERNWLSPIKQVVAGSNPALVSNYLVAQRTEHLKYRLHKYIQSTNSLAWLCGQGDFRVDYC